jgi:TfoX/Sxy family transcriptional regulator of competence genes
VTGSPEFADLVALCAAWPGVEVPDGSRRGFGSTALRVGGRIFAMESMGRLVVKLPAERVRGLLDSGEGQPFTAGKAKWLKEWVSLPLDHPEADAIAREAYDFVGGSP